MIGLCISGGGAKIGFGVGVMDILVEMCLTPKYLKPLSHKSVA